MQVLECRELPECIAQLPTVPSQQQRIKVGSKYQPLSACSVRGGRSLKKTHKAEAAKEQPISRLAVYLTVYHTNGGASAGGGGVTFLEP